MSALIAVLVSSGSPGQALTSSTKSGYICTKLSKLVAKQDRIYVFCKLFIIKTLLIWACRFESYSGSLLYSQECGFKRVLAVFMSTNIYAIFEYAGASYSSKPGINGLCLNSFRQRFGILL